MGAGAELKSSRYRFLAAELFPKPLKLLFSLVSGLPPYTRRRQELKGGKELGDDFSFISMNSKRFLESPSFGVCCCLF